MIFHIFLSASDVFRLFHYAAMIFFHAYIDRDAIADDADIAPDAAAPC